MNSKAWASWFAILFTANSIAAELHPEPLGIEGSPIMGSPYDRCAGGVIRDVDQFDLGLSSDGGTLDTAMKFSLGAAHLERVCVAITGFFDGVEVNYDIAIWDANGAGGSSPGELISLIPAAVVTASQGTQWIATETDFDLPPEDVYIGIRLYPGEPFLVVDTSIPNDSQLFTGLKWIPVGGIPSTLLVRLVLTPMFRQGFESQN